MTSPVEQGRQRGLKEKPGIIHVLNEIERAASFFNLSADDYLKVDESNLRHVPERIIDECKGIAVGAGISEDQALGINFGKGPYSFFHEGCTAFTVPGLHSADGAPLLMKNRDLGYRRIHPQVLAYSRLDGYNEFLGVTTAGNAYWYQGVNEMGLVAFNTATLCGKYEEGMTINILIRRLLEECDTVDEALRFIESEKVSACSNLFLGDRDRNVVAELKNGFPVHIKTVEKPDARANHYIYHDNPPFTEKEIILHRQYTLTRYERAKEMLNTVDEVSVDDLIRFARDHDHGPGSFSVCRHNSYLGTELEKLMSSSTISSQIFKIGDTVETWVALGRPCQTEFVHHTWGDEIIDELSSAKLWLRNLSQK